MLSHNARTMTSPLMTIWLWMGNPMRSERLVSTRMITAAQDGPPDAARAAADGRAAQDGHGNGVQVVSFADLLV